MGSKTGPQSIANPAGMSGVRSYDEKRAHAAIHNRSSPVSQVPIALYGGRLMARAMDQSKSKCSGQWHPVGGDVCGELYHRTEPAGKSRSEYCSAELFRPNWTACGVRRPNERRMRGS